MITSTTEPAMAVVDVLRHWSRDKFVTDFAHLSLTNVHGLNSTAPQLTAQVLESGAGDGAVARSVDLQTLVASRVWSEVRLLMLFDAGLSTVAATDGLSPAAMASGVAWHVKQAMPFDAEVRAALPTRLSTVRLFAPTSGMTPYPPEWTGGQQEWGYSFVLAPEDRVGPGTAADLIRYPGNYAAHVAGAVCSLSGIWTGMDQMALPPDSDGSLGSGPEGLELRVIRTQNRVATLELPLDEIIDEAVAVAGGVEAYPPGVDTGLRVLSPAGSVRLRQEAVTGMLGHNSHTLIFRNLGLPPEQQDRQIDSAELIDSYWRFMFGGNRKPDGSRSIRSGDGSFRGAVVEPVQTVWWSLLESRDRALHKSFVGDGTGQRFRSRASLPAELAERVGEQLKAIKQEQEESERPVSVEDYGGGYWGHFRSLTLGLVDGSGPNSDSGTDSVVDVAGSRKAVAASPPAPQFSADTADVLRLDQPDLPAFDLWTRAAALHRLSEVVDALSESDEDESSGEDPVSELPEQADPNRLGTGQRVLRGVLGAVVAGGLATTWGTLSGWISYPLIALSGYLLVTAILARDPLKSWLDSAADAGLRSRTVPGENPMRPGPLGSSHDLAKSTPEVSDAQLAAVPGLVRSLDLDLQAGTEWLQASQGTALGDVARSVGGEIDRTEVEITNDERELAGIRPASLDELQGRRKAWFFWFWMTLLAWPAGLYFLSRFWAEDPTGIMNLGPLGEVENAVFYPSLMVVWTLLWAFLLGRGLRRYYMAYQRFRHQFMRTQRTMVGLGARIHRGISERERLIAINDGMAKWAEALAWLVTQPYQAADIEPGHGDVDTSLHDPEGDLGDIQGHQVGDSGSVGGSEAEELSSADLLGASNGSAEPSDSDGVSGEGDEASSSGGETDSAGVADAYSDTLHAPEPNHETETGPNFGTTPAARYAGSPAPASPNPEVFVAASAPTDPVSPEPADEAPAEPDYLPALGTRFGSPEPTPAFLAGERRRAVRLAAGRGWLHNLLHRSLELAFQDLGLDGDDVLHRMDTEGSGSFSMLDMFNQELRAGSYRAEMRTDLTRRLAEQRAQLDEAGGSGFLQLKCPDIADASVATFLDELSGEGASFRQIMWNQSGKVEGKHQLEDSKLWTHLRDANVATECVVPVNVDVIDVPSNPERIQVVSVRVDASPTQSSQEMTCFAKGAEQSSSKSTKERASGTTQSPPTSGKSGLV